MKDSWSLQLQLNKSLIEYWQESQNSDPLMMVRPHFGGTEWTPNISYVPEHIFTTCSFGHVTFTPVLLCKMKQKIQNCGGKSGLQGRKSVVQVEILLEQFRAFDCRHSVGEALGDRLVYLHESSACHVPEVQFETSALACNLTQPKCKPITWAGRAVPVWTELVCTHWPARASVTWPGAPSSVVMFQPQRMLID